MFTVGRLAHMRAAIRPAVRGRAVAIWGGVGRLAGIVGPASGGFVAAWQGSAAVFVLQVALFFCGCVWSFLFDAAASGAGAVGLANVLMADSSPPPRQPLSSLYPLSATFLAHF
eukprot:SAG11_NODE_5288_length_1605_cov_1.408367_1_plen_114_part_00